MKTRITEMLGIDYPIIQGGMMWVGRAELSAAVSNAGGLGILTALTQPTPEALADEIARSAPLAVRAIKRALRHNVGWDPKPAARYEAALQADTLTTEDAKEGMAALLEKRTPEFQGR